jgi:hypothetical protein
VKKTELATAGTQRGPAATYAGLPIKKDDKKTRAKKSGAKK